MLTTTLTLLLTLGGCFSTPSAPSPEEAVAPAPEAKGKKAKGKKAKTEADGEPAAEGDEQVAAEAAPRERRPPVMRTARYTVPLAALSAEQLPALQAAAVAAWNEAAKTEQAPITEGFPKPWKCRRATVYEVERSTDGALPALRVFERQSKPTCDAPDAKAERWELSLRYEFDERPAHRDGGGEFDYLMSSIDLSRDGDAWKTSYAHVFRRDSGDLSVGFTHDDAWLAGQLPKEVKLTGKSAVVNSERWALGKFTIADEQVAVEVERWSCRDGGAYAGGELVFRTNKREAGHTPTSPKDVLISETLRTFADALVTKLGDLRGGLGATTPAALTCAK